MKLSFKNIKIPIGFPSKYHINILVCDKHKLCIKESFDRKYDDILSALLINNKYNTLTAVITSSKIYKNNLTRAFDLVFDTETFELLSFGNTWLIAWSNLTDN